MVHYNDLVGLLNKYGINGEKLIKNNKNILEYAILDNVEDIIIFLQSIGIKAKNIEKCPSILYMKNVHEIKEIYHFLVTKTELKYIEIEDCLHILSSNLEEVKKIYNYVSDKYGISTLKKTTSILSGDYNNIVSLTNTLENTLGLDMVKNDGGTMLVKTTSDELKKILTIPEFNYNPITKEYNKELLSASTFFKNYLQIKDILELPYWKEKKYEALLTPTVWNKDADQIKDILELSYWKEKKYEPLLTPTVWNKDADQIERNIQICVANGLELYSNSPNLVLRLTANELQAKINFLNYWGIPLINDNGKICNIFGMTNKNMQVKYGISKKELTQNYLKMEEKKHVL